MTDAETARLARPFSAAIRARARSIAAAYQFVIEPDSSVGFIGWTSELPGVMGGGKTVPACYADTLEATTAAIAAMLERDQRPPSPAREGRRDRQVNIRLTAEEKSRLEALANRDGFRTISDYIRAAALAPAQHPRRARRSRRP